MVQLTPWLPDRPLRLERLGEKRVLDRVNRTLAHPSTAYVQRLPAQLAEALGGSLGQDPERLEHDLPPVRVHRSSSGERLDDAFRIVRIWPPDAEGGP